MISVIMERHKIDEYVEGASNSILIQSFSNFEFIIANGFEENKPSDKLVIFLCKNIIRTIELYV